MDMREDDPRQFFKSSRPALTAEEVTAHISDPELRNAAIGMAGRIKQETETKIAEALAKSDHRGAGKAILVGHDKTQAYIDRMAKIADDIAQEKLKGPPQERDTGRDR